MQTGGEHANSMQGLSLVEFKLRTPELQGNKANHLATVLPVNQHHRYENNEYTNLEYLILQHYLTPFTGGPNWARVPITGLGY